MDRVKKIIKAEDADIDDNYSPGDLLSVAASALSGGSSGLGGSFSPTANFATMFSGLAESDNSKKELSDDELIKKYSK